MNRELCWLSTRGSKNQGRITASPDTRRKNTPLWRASELVGMLLASLLLGACASYQLVNPEPADIERKVKVADTVTVFTTNSETLRLRVTALTSDALIGEDPVTFKEHRIPFREIGLVEKKVKLPETAIALSIIFALMAACAANCGP